MQGGAADTRTKMRPDMMIVEMTTAEQQQYLRHDDNSGSRMTPLTPMMPGGNPRSIKIVEGGYCSDTRYEEKLQEKGAQHKALEEALKDYGSVIWLDCYQACLGQGGTPPPPAGQPQSLVHHPHTDQQARPCFVELNLEASLTCFYHHASNNDITCNCCQQDCYRYVENAIRDSSSF